MEGGWQAKGSTDPVPVPWKELSIISGGSIPPPHRPRIGPKPLPVRCCWVPLLRPRRLHWPCRWVLPSNHASVGAPLPRCCLPPPPPPTYTHTLRTYTKILPENRTQPGGTPPQTTADCMKPGVPTGQASTLPLQFTPSPKGSRSNALVVVLCTLSAMCVDIPMPKRRSQMVTLQTVLHKRTVLYRLVQPGPSALRSVWLAVVVIVCLQRSCRAARPLNCLPFLRHRASRCHQEATFWVDIYYRRQQCMAALRKTMNSTTADRAQYDSKLKRERDRVAESPDYKSLQAMQVPALASYRRDLNRQTDIVWRTLINNICTERGPLAAEPRPQGLVGLQCREQSVRVRLKTTVDPKLTDHRDITEHRHEDDMPAQQAELAQVV